MSNSLAGRRIVVTRSAEQADSFATRLAGRGAIPLLFPVIQFRPLPPELLDAALDEIGGYDWLVFTSGNAVSFFFQRADRREDELALPRVAAIGSATGRKLAGRGIQPDFVPDEFVGQALASGLGDLSGRRVLLPRARIGRPEIVQLLQAQGAVVDDIPLYDTVTAEPSSDPLSELIDGFDAITFTSPSSVRNFLKIVDDQPPGIAGAIRAALRAAVVACIGPVTAEEARDSGLETAVVPDEYTIDGLIDALAMHFRETGSANHAGNRT